MAKGGMTMGNAGMSGGIEKLNRQMSHLLGIQMEVMKAMRATTSVVDATTKSMDNLGKSAEDVTRKTERVETGLGNFVINVLRAQKGPAGIFHKMMYGVGGYFIFKNRMDTLLSGIDKFVVRPLSGLKGEDEKQGMIGKMFFGVGGSYRKTKKQLETVANLATNKNIKLRDSTGKFVKGGGSARNLFKKDVLNQRHIKAAIKFYNIQKKGEKFQAWIGSKGKKWMNSAGSALKSLGIMGVMALKFFFGVTLALLLVYGIVKLLRKAGLDGAKLKEIGFAMWNAMQVGLTIIWESLSLIWEGAKQMYDGLFGDGDFSDVLMGWLKIAGGILGVLFGVAVALVWPLLVGVWEMAKVVFWAMVDWAMGKYEENANAVYDTFMWGVTIIGGIMVFLGVVFASILGWPVVIGGFILMAIGALFDMFNPFAAGGVTTSGMSLVGERGPELVRLPTGSRVHSNAESKQMMSGGGGNNITVNVQGRIGASDSELRLIAQKVGQMINKEINRTTSSRGLGA